MVMEKEKQHGRDKHSLNSHDIDLSIRLYK